MPDERIAVRVDTPPVADRKWAAIGCHRTQLEEHERIPEPLLGDPFTGLDAPAGMEPGR